MRDGKTSSPLALDAFIQTVIDCDAARFAFISAFICAAAAQHLLPPLSV
jgi:hypothetical protein